MLEISFLYLFYLLLTVGIGLFATLVFIAPNCPVVLREFVVYGKFSSNDRPSFFKYFEVPKRWFAHFYIVSCVWSSICVYWAVSQYYYGQSTFPIGLKHILRQLAKPNVKRYSVNELGALITICLLCLNACRRLFETLFTSVYSETNMNIVHYVTGMSHYVIMPICVLVECPGFAYGTATTIKLTDLRWFHLVGTVLFLVASSSQHQCFEILASMRRGVTGNIATYAHGIPYSGWFQLVSCPHFMFEIIIYLSLYFTLEMRHCLWLLIVLFVSINQLLAALITHRWYLNKFPTLYPKERRAIVPYVL